MANDNLKVNSNESKDNLNMNEKETPSRDELIKQLKYQVETGCAYYGSWDCEQIEDFFAGLQVIAERFERSETTPMPSLTDERWVKLLETATTFLASANASHDGLGRMIMSVDVQDFNAFKQAKDAARYLTLMADSVTNEPAKPEHYLHSDDNYYWTPEARQKYVDRIAELEREIRNLKSKTNV